MEDLLRVQKLSDGALRAAETVNLKFEADWAQSDIEQWLSRINIMELGLKSARTCLRMMVGGREEKQIYSEETLQTILNVLKNVIDDCIAPIVELRSNSAIFKLFAAEKKVLGAVSRVPSIKYHICRECSHGEGICGWRFQV